MFNAILVCCSAEKYLLFVVSWYNAGIKTLNNVKNIFNHRPISKIEG